MNNTDTLIIKHPGYHGFFSYCSVALYQIINYNNNNKKLPDIVSMKEIFTMFKNNEDDDISENFFIKSNNNILDLNINEQIRLVDQFEDYNIINFDHYTPFINKYFSLSNEIKNIISNIENKYNIDYNNTCCVFYRGNDKITETIIPSYDVVNNKVNELFPNKLNIKFLLQSDETEFLNYFKSVLSNYMIFNDEIKHICKQKTSINHITNYHTKFNLIKNFLAIVKIMSKCKYVICNAGNISLWITLFRGNNNNVYVFNNEQWL